MDMLKLALDARLPFICVKSDDLLYVEEVLTHIAGCEVSGYQGHHEGSEWTLPQTDVSFTSQPLVDPSLYLALEKANKSLVFVNVKGSALFFDGGVLLPPKDLIHQTLKEIFGSKKKADGLLSAFGGLTLKDTYELIRLTQEKFDDVTANGINEVRQGYISKLKGMVQVDTEQAFYQMPSYLGDWLNLNVPFLLKPIEGLTPRGLLFDGPPGTGKTAASKAIANALGRPLFRMDIGGMKGKYVGDSEGNLQAALQVVDQMEPCVVLFDEIEKMFAGNGTDSSGVTSSMLSTLLWWLQEHESQVFSIMTTNSLQSIPPEAYREGRIDAKMTFRGLETKSQVLDFAANVASHFDKQLKIPGLYEKVMSKFHDSLPNIMASNTPVPQAKIEQCLRNLIKEVLTEKV